MLSTYMLDTLKIKKFCFSREGPIQPCRPKSDSAPPEAIWAKLKPKQPHQKAIPVHTGPISALGSKSAVLDWTEVLAPIRGTKLDSKIELYFTHRNGPIFRVKTDLSKLRTVYKASFQRLIRAAGGFYSPNRKTKKHKEAWCTCRVVVSFETYCFLPVLVAVAVCSYSTG